jgi:hypothetical protein
MGREKHRPIPKQKACQVEASARQGKSVNGESESVAEWRNVNAHKETSVDARAHKGLPVRRRPHRGIARDISRGSEIFLKRPCAEEENGL